MTSYLRYLRINLLTFSYVRCVSISTPLPIVVVVGYVILYDYQVDVTFSELYK
jgi:hypothetical protein